MRSASTDARSRRADAARLGFHRHSEFGSRHQQYEKFYGGASFLVKQNVYRNFDFKRATALVDAALNLPPVASDWNVACGCGATELLRAPSPHLGRGWGGGVTELSIDHNPSPHPPLPSELGFTRVRLQIRLAEVGSSDFGWERGEQTAFALPPRTITLAFHKCENCVATTPS